MAKTLTITIEGIEEEMWDSMWDYAKKSAIKEIGVQIEETDHIQLDFDTVMTADKNIAGSVISGAVTCHLVMTAEEFLNKKKKP